MCYDNWNNLLPKDLLIDIVERLSYVDDYYRFSAVCKSWNSAAAATEKPWWLPTRVPMLLLAEFAKDYGYFDEEGYSKDDGDGDGDDASRIRYDYLNNSIDTSRGLYSLSTMKSYNIELPEAAGKLILTTSKGWLLTVDKDSQINLLHPPSRYQFSLPPMITFPIPPQDLEDYDPRKDSRKFISKVAMSSRLLKRNIDASFFHKHTTPLPIVMAVHEKSGSLGFARLGDRVWTDAQVPSDIHDIVYHKGNFFAVNFKGVVYVCCIDSDEEKGGPRQGTKIASIKHLVVHEYGMGVKMYLVEPLSGSGLLLIVRYIKVGMQLYRTIKFVVWRLNLNYNDSLKIPSCTLSKVNNLGNEAIFVGRASSFSVSSSDIIKANSIYFTDDYVEAYLYIGGGHDNGIFDMEHRTIRPHFQRKSIHCISPPLWYI